MKMKHGAVVIAAITSCTNTSNPSVMVGAGLLAKKALEKGLNVKPYVKTVLAPGSRVVTEYLKQANLIDPLVASLDSTSSPMDAPPVSATQVHFRGKLRKLSPAVDLVAAAVLSGNRNFEGRVHPLVKANFLASPPLVVAYALAGTVDIDLDKEPLGEGTDGHLCISRIFWPTQQEIAETIASSVKVEHVLRQRYASVFERLRYVEGDQGHGRRYVSNGMKTPPTSIIRLISRA